MIRRCLLLIFILWMTATLTGCWDRRELNTISIAVGMGLDKTDNNYLQVTMQVVNPSEVSANKASGYSPPISVYSATGITTLEAIRKLTTIAPRELFLAQLRVLVIGEQLAREGIAELLDGIARNYEIRSDFYIIVAKENSALNVLEILTPVEKISANKMFDTLERSERLWAPTTTVQLDQLIEETSNPVKNAVLTGVEIIGDLEKGKSLKNLEHSKPPTSLQYSGIAMFKRDKLIDWLNEEESKGLNYLTDHVKNSMGHISCPGGGAVGIEVTRTKTKVKGKVIRGKPEILVDIYSEESISEVQCKIDLKNPDNIKKLEKMSEEYLREITEAAIHKAKENNVDIFDFGNAIEDASPKTWIRLKDDWNQNFSNLNVTIRANVNLRRSGTLTNSLLERKE